jgi:hypothetical protein
LSKRAVYYDLSEAEVSITVPWGQMQRATTRRGFVVGGSGGRTALPRVPRRRLVDPDVNFDDRNPQTQEQLIGG